MFRVLLGMDCIISELFYESTILQRSYRKMTNLWSFSYNSIVKFNGFSSADLEGGTGGPDPPWKITS